jgi:hypothetical protein
MSNPAVAMPAQTLADNNILPAIPSTSSPEAKKEPASKSTYADTGITTTVANVQTLAETITFFGGSYTSIPLLAPANLNAMHTQATALVAAVANKKGANDIEVNSRQNQFDDVPELSTRVINALMASGATKQTVHDARYFINKLNGNRVDKSNPDNERQKSVSEQSYVQQVQHFDGLVIVVKNDPFYDPQVEALKVVSLEAKLQDMTDANKSVTTSRVALDMQRMERNTYFNTPVTGLVDVCLSVKKNVKAIFGATSPQYKMVSGLAFRRIENK